MLPSLTLKEAINQAAQCEQCTNAPCRLGCPLNNNIPAFLAQLSQGNLGSAYATLAETTSLPAICGTLCAHEKQCEARCQLIKKGQPINISKLEHFVAEMFYTNSLKPQQHSTGTAGKVAVIGSGPTGLTVAGELIKHNCAVTLLEGQNSPGGVLRYGIPEFRLDKELVQLEINNLTHYGVRFINNILIGKDETLETLMAQGYQAIFVGTGSALPKTLHIPGENLSGILTATYFLRMMILADKNELTQNEERLEAEDEVVVIGAGNVALDVARTAARQGAKLVTVVYHKSPAEMTALAADYTAALKEGIQFKFLRQPAAYLSGRQMHTLGVLRKTQERTMCTSTNKLAGLMLDTIAKQPDGSFASTGSQEILPCTKTILAIGQRPAAQIFAGTKGIELDEDGFVQVAQEPYGMTTRPGIFSGGDVVNGPSSVVLAIEDAKQVAQGILSYLTKNKA